MTTPPNNLATNDIIDENWVDAVTNNLNEVNGLGAGAWINMALVAPWVNFGGALQIAQYRKVGDRVEIRGVIKSGVINTAFFTLPVGYRPPTNGDMGWPVVSNSLFGYTVISSAGVCTPAVGSNVSFNLAGIWFSVTA
jgi:hypothetical protein